MAVSYNMMIQNLELGVWNLSPSEIEIMKEKNW